MGVFWNAWALIYQPILSDFRKTVFLKSVIFSEGARVVSVNFSDLGQMVKQLDSLRVDLGCVGPDLSICEVRIQKNSKP